MSNANDKFAKGAANMRAIYADIIDAGEPGNDRFMDLMVPHLFGEVWDKEILSIEQRRLFTMGIIAAMGEAGVFEIQCMAAYKNGELSAEQLRELAIHAAPYAGYPRVGGLRGAVENAIRNVDKENS
jgi:4-carboxymuconolactone decarboxylase